MQDRLGLARRIQSAVETHAADEQDHRAALPREARRKPTTFKLGSFCYYQVQRFTRAAADGMKFTPTWIGPYVKRCSEGMKEQGRRVGASLPHLAH
jgi:hypothetical protein